jgi:hypothetical protein
MYSGGPWTPLSPALVQVLGSLASLTRLSLAHNMLGDEATTTLMGMMLVALSTLEYPSLSLSTLQYLRCTVVARHTAERRWRWLHALNPHTHGHFPFLCAAGFSRTEAANAAARGARPIGHCGPHTTDNGGQSCDEHDWPLLLCSLIHAASKPAP